MQSDKLRIKVADGLKACALCTCLTRASPAPLPHHPVRTFADRLCSTQMLDVCVGSDADFTDVKTILTQQTGIPVCSQVLLCAASISLSARRRVEHPVLTHTSTAFHPS